jgi:mono/diheme cytochrome c family protein
MKKLKKILKWTGIILLVLILGITVITASRQNLKFEAPYPEVRASKDTAIIARGRHLALSIAHCVDCHSTANNDSLLALGQDPPFTGGFVFDLPLGKIYSKNITPDSATGIGRYTDAEIARALRYSVHPDGTVVYDFMPFHNMSDEDLTAVISYLRSRPAVSNKVPDHDLNAIGKVVKAFLVKPAGPEGPVAKSVQPDTTAAYGKYLVMNVGNCNGCHTQRSMTGEAEGPSLAGGNPIQKKGFPALTPPNLTPAKDGRITGWTQDMFTDRFRKGRLIPHSEMPWNSFQRMNDVELKAIYKYLVSLKPEKTTGGPQ